jgi:hypothetical protein
MRLRERGLPTPLQFKQCSQAFPDVGENLGRRLRFKDNPSRFPIEVLHVVRKHKSSDQQIRAVDWR